MNRVIIGVALLVVLLAVGLFSGWKMERIHEPIADWMEQAAMQSLRGEQTQAEEQVRRAEDAWLRSRHFTAALADHGPMEEIEALFARLPSFQQDSVQYSATCAELSRKIHAMSEAQELSIGSFF